VHRVLVPGGRAVVMLYNRRSVRHLLQPARALVSPEWRSEFASRIRGLYDFDPSGETAPHIDFVTRREARRLFAVFERIRIDAQNFPEYRLGDKPLRRQWFLTNLARVIGLDLYIVADKAPRPA
jgi:hypothetical protein